MTEVIGFNARNERISKLADQFARDDAHGMALARARGDEQAYRKAFGELYPLVYVTAYQHAYGEVCGENFNDAFNKWMTEALPALRLV
jgi:hypothetical protein